MCLCGDVDPSPPPCFAMQRKRQATKEWKFSVVESVMGCKERAVLGQEVLESLRKVLKEGPFFVPARTRNVATAE